MTRLRLRLNGRDRARVLLHGDGGRRAALVPPLQKERNVGHRTRRECRDLLVNRLNVGYVGGAILQTETQNDLLERFLGREGGDAGEKGRLVGSAVGSADGSVDGTFVGSDDGSSDGSFVGSVDGLVVGPIVGVAVGTVAPFATKRTFLTRRLLPGSPFEALNVSPRYMVPVVDVCVVVFRSISGVNQSG